MNYITNNPARSYFENTLSNFPARNLRSPRIQLVVVRGSRSASLLLNYKHGRVYNLVDHARLRPALRSFGGAEARRPAKRFSQ